MEIARKKQYNDIVGANGKGWKPGRTAYNGCRRKQVSIDRVGRLKGTYRSQFSGLQIMRRNKEIGKHEETFMSLMWCKAYQNKACHIVDTTIKPILNMKKNIRHRELKLDAGMDHAMTLVFSNEKVGTFKGDGFGVIHKYFNLPRSKGSSTKQMRKLRIQVENKTKRVCKKMRNLRC
ncbi:hypothetical protein LXL04_033008 [Taraxacum kok-saghyz]